MSARSSALTSAGFRQTAARDTASKRHCCDTGSTGFTRSTIARRCARLICRAFVPKNRFRPSACRSAGTECALPLAACAVGQAAALKNTRGAVQQLLLPIVDLVRMNPELTRQFGDRPGALDRRERHLRLERRIVLLPCPFHVLLLRHRRFLGQGPTLTYCLIFGVQLTLRGARSMAWCIVLRPEGRYQALRLRR